ncbi:ABC multidrug transporter B [Metarhizium brunneum]|uniref:ABC multidrug transporter B n=1 Tax=Metarhizium brunneum TaxID=500148 RepID=A0A7D5Z1W0_9HYPO|nr:ABC multidrug transporter B [Metarhizium brunneum]
MVLLVLESQNKTESLLSMYKGVSPEDSAGILSRTFWWWLMDLLAVGKQRILRVSDTPRLSSSLQPSLTRKAVLQAWNDRGSQPVIISRAISFITNDQGGVAQSCRAYEIFFAALIVYFGLAISSSMYKNTLNKLDILIRESLVHLVYDKTLNLSHHGSDAGRVVTLMSTDIDSVSEMGRLLHASWGQAVELVIGMILLAREVGWVFPVPLVIIVFASRVSRFVAQNVRSRTKSWNDATQARISTLSTVLNSMRSVKAMGLSEAIAKYINELRDKEIDRSKHVRWMQVLYNASANANGLFTPVITVVLYAMLAASRGERLDTKTAFTTVAILSLVTHPANMMMTIFPKFVGIMANVDRIQSFLLEPSRVDCRKIIDGSQFTETENCTGIRLDDVTVKFKSTTAATLKHINLNLPKHSITACAGPTGCGKTTLAKTILGEVSPVQGIVTVSSRRIAYCDQRVWIPIGTIRDIICTFATKVDESLYQEALRVCCLDYDLQRLPDGDRTVVGSQGVNLSGGQRQRIALARMVYSGASIAVLDDPFSALDGVTENKVVDNLLGKNGWFRRAKVTAFIITYAAQHFQHSDGIILLQDGHISAQGDWRAIKSRASEMLKFNFEETQSSTVEPTGKSQYSTAKQAETDADKDLHRSVGDMTLYSYYIRSVGVWNFLLLATCTALYATFNTFTTYWFKLWTESDGDRVVFYIVGYVLLAFTAWAATSANLWSTFILLAPRSGRLLHQSLLTTTMAAPLLYFSSTDVGIVLNRFSKDISLVDRQLPLALSNLCSQIFKMLAQAVILMQVQRLLLVTLPICIVIVYLVQRIYLRTSRQLRVLELESYSSLNSWFLETTEGLVSIRAFNWIKPATGKNLENLETSIRPSYSLVSLQCWLNLVLDLLVSCIAIGIILIAALWRSETSAANVGVSLNLILVANTTLVRLVESFTQLEVSLGAIARLNEVETQTPSEDRPWEDQVPPSSWPEKGSLTLSGFSAGYNDDHNVLRDINLSVGRGEKLVICGRTGSGKSTILLGILRLIESSGEVEIDRRLLSQVPRNIIRKRAFITVPQEPLFLPSASLSFNLDPDAQASEQMLQEALQSVGIWDVVCEIARGKDSDPLSQPASSLQALSAGQLQLISMARAIVKMKIISQGVEYKDGGVNVDSPKPILVLDEATASLDAETEGRIYDIIESEFVADGHTVVIVAHRISVLAKTMRPGKDKVAWLQDGRVVKVGDYEEIVKFASSTAIGEGQ